jgi:hypothetical protein
MSLRIVDKDCRIENGKLVIVIEGEGPEEVLSNTAKNLALQKAAACGYPRVGINGQSGSFPVDAEGKTYDDWNEQSKRGLIAAYRNEILLMGGL